MRSFAEILEQEEKDKQEDARKAAEIEYDMWLQKEIAKNEGGVSASGSGGRGKGRGRGGGQTQGQRKVPTRGKGRGGGGSGAATNVDSGHSKTPATARIDDDPTLQERGSPAKSRGGGGRGGRGRGYITPMEKPHRQINGSGLNHAVPIIGSGVSRAIPIVPPPAPSTPSLTKTTAPNT